MAAEDSSEGSCGYEEELHESIDHDDEAYSIDGDADSPLKKKLKAMDDCLDQSSDSDSPIEATEEYL